MSKLFPTLFSPGQIGNLRLKNRVIKAPLSTSMAGVDGSVTERLIRYYIRQAAGGCAMVIVESLSIDELGSKTSHCGHLALSSDEYIGGLAWLAENIKEQGALAGAQLEHCGRQKFFPLQPIVAPSEIPWPALWEEIGIKAVPRALTIPEIKDIVSAFGDAALRVKKAGFDLVEIHGAHGYLLTNFFSPHTNKRTDLYGGSLENRMRIFIEVYRDVRSKVGPDFPVIIRLSGTDYQPDGYPIEDTIVLAKALEKEGIDGLHISGGDYHTMVHQTTPMSLSLCHNVWAAEAIKKEVKVPVIASGSITLPKYAEDILSSAKSDFISLGRPLCADPEWPLKAYQDRPEDIRPCIRCNEGCMERTFFNHKAITCAVNPLISREGELDIRTAPQKRKIAVVGAGPAGLEAARVASLRGHDVVVFEKTDRLGGALNKASVPEFKADIRELVSYLITTIKKLGIKINHLKASAKDLEGFDAVIVATGAKPIELNVPGIHNANVVKATEILEGTVKPGKSVAVIGGGLVGTETALYLHSLGHNVTIVEMLPSIMDDVGSSEKLVYSDMLNSSNIQVMTDTKLWEVKERSITVKNKNGFQEVESDTVVLAVGFEPEQALYDDLISAGKEAYLIGDAAVPGKIFDAFHTAYRVGAKI